MGGKTKFGRPGRLSERLDTLQNVSARTPGLRVYLSYRRGDSDRYVDMIEARITRRFGSGSVVRDVGFTPGRFGPAASIDVAVQTVTVILVVIGPGWARALAGDGKTGQWDPIALEVRAAAERHCPVVPVLVDGAMMPAGSEPWDRLAAEYIHEPIVISQGRRSPRLRPLLVMLARSRPTRRRVADVGRRARVVGLQLMRPRALIPIGIVVLVIVLVLPSVDTDADLLRGDIPAAIRPDCQVTGSDQYLALSVNATASAMCPVSAKLRSVAPGAPAVVDYALIDGSAGLAASFARYLSHDDGHNEGAYRNGTLAGAWGEGVLQNGDNFVVFIIEQESVLVLAVGSGDVKKWFVGGGSSFTTVTHALRVGSGT